MSEEAADPGASRHGNFINYYQFHPAEERLRQLPRSIQQPRQRRKYVALDVGCNAGISYSQDLTLELHKFLSSRLPGCEVSILGIDLDPVLIGRARQKNDRPESVTFECLDFFADERQSVVSSYLRKHRVLPNLCMTLRARSGSTAATASR
ncbi:probable RNA methyltransferase CG11342 isoform X3 [Nasonia vitripennis]|uniref:RNA methyltransferase n=1 Tax=Nasonia vitripennis TaxID=7425 RepID=A0A7M7QXS2_NASVI|nr:probable RNA methyltransferase CG11342 isoform X3 [Nasonia vitripennis]